MISTLVSFIGVAVLLSLLPGPATALVVRSAAVHGRRSAFVTVLGNSTGIMFWALASVLGISALVAASEAAFTALRISGAVVLVYLGVQAVRKTAVNDGEPAARPEFLCRRARHLRRQSQARRLLHRSPA